MRRAVLAAAVGVAFASPAVAQGFTDCSRAPNQIEATQCAERGWAKADKELNRLWKLVKPKADRQGTGASLLTQQRAWLKYRDATCEAERNDYAGGSIAGQIYWSCMDRLTRVRNRELKALK